MTTNREKLAKMTNEELAEFLYNTTCCDRCSNKNRLDCYARFCKQGTLQWLNQECEVKR